MSEAIRDLLVFALAMFVMFLVWIVTGGPERYISHVGPYLKPPPPLDTGEPYSLRFGSSTPPSDRSQINRYFPSGNFTPSATPQRNEETLGINARFVRNAQNPSQEFFSVTNTSPARITLTGSVLASEASNKTTVGTGSELPYLGRLNPEGEILLLPGDTAHIVSGRSPIGSSFRVNSCSGYLAQFQTFTPELPQACPFPEDDLPLHLRGSSCGAYAAKLPRCKIVLDQTTIPPDANGSCKLFVDTLGYNACVDRHKNDRDFFKPEWRIYLSKDALLWQKNRLIKVVRPDKKVIGSVSY